MQEYLALEAAADTIVVLGSLAFLVRIDDRDRYEFQIRVMGPGSAKGPVISYDEAMAAKREATRRIKRRALLARADKRRRATRSGNTDTATVSSAPQV